MNKYWFKKSGKGGYIPTTWQGWALFTIFIGLITQVYNFVSGIIPIVIISVIIAGIYFGLMKLRTSKDE